MKTRIIEIEKLGKADIVSPLAERNGETFVGEEESVVHKAHRSEIADEASGSAPRRRAGNDCGRMLRSEEVGVPWWHRRP